MTDVYELAKSEMNQSISSETPYESKKYNFIADINNGVYTNAQQSLVSFDLSSIYNSGAFIDLSQMYLTIPLIYTACFSTGAAAVAPTAAAGNEFLITPKSGSWNLIQSLEVVINGKNVIQNTPNINFYTNFKMLSQMSQDDLKAFGRTLGIQPDDVQSYIYNGYASALAAGAYPAGVGSVYGNGLCNNMIFPVGSTGVAVANSSYDQQNAFSNYSSAGSVYNSALYYRSQRMANNITTGVNGFVTPSAPVAGQSYLFNGGTNSSANLNNEFLPYFCIANTNYMTWYDAAIIRLQDICDFFHQAPICKNLDGLLRIYVNTGALGVNLSKATDAGMCMSQSNSSFNNTCPFTINQLPVANVPATTTNLAVSLTIARANVSTSIFGVSLNSGMAHPMTSCRVYFPMIKLKPEVALKYICENRAKKVVYTNVLSNTINNISAGSTYSQLIQSGVRNIKGILIIPFLSQTVNGLLNAGANVITGITPFAPYQSPFDTAPCTTPMSLTQINIAIGGENQCMNFYNYTYENFLQQIGMYEQINGGDLGLSCGLISQFMWEHAYRYYWFDCSRGTLADMNSPRNVNITFNNNSLMPIDLWIFCENYNEAIMDVETGKIL